MPKKNKIVLTPNGKGKITDVAPLRGSVYVYIEELGIKEFQLGEIQEMTTSSSEHVSTDGAQYKNEPRNEKSRNRRNSRKR